MKNSVKRLPTSQNHKLCAWLFRFVKLLIFSQFNLFYTRYIIGISVAIVSGQETGITGSRKTRQQAGGLRPPPKHRKRFGREENLSLGPVTMPATSASLNYLDVVRRLTRKSAKIREGETTPLNKSDADSPNRVGSACIHSD